MTTIEDLDLPRTELIATTEAWVQSIEPPYLYNHSVRAYVFGRALGQRRGLEPREDYDDELLFLSCVLHDVGLTEPGDGDQRFEVDGADLAAQFLLERGLPSERTDIVWDAIALHTSPGIANRKRPEIALMQAGTATDVMGGPTDLPPGLAEQTLEVLPRLDLQSRIRHAIADQAAVKPTKAPPTRSPASWCVRMCRMPASPHGTPRVRQAAGANSPARARSDSRKPRRSLFLVHVAEHSPDLVGAVADGEEQIASLCFASDP